MQLHRFLATLPEFESARYTPATTYQTYANRANHQPLPAAAQRVFPGLERDSAKPIGSGLLCLPARLLDCLLSYCVLFGQRFSLHLNATAEPILKSERVAAVRVLPGNSNNSSASSSSSSASAPAAAQESTTIKDVHKMACSMGAWTGDAVSKLFPSLHDDVRSELAQLRSDLAHSLELKREADSGREVILWLQVGLVLSSAVCPG